jgi:hypothetical protein
MKRGNDSGFEIAHFETLEPRRLMSAAAMAVVPMEMPMTNLLANLQLPAQPVVTDQISFGDTFGQVNFVELNREAAAQDNIQTTAISEAHRLAKADSDLANFDSTVSVFAMVSVVGDRIFSQVKVASNPNCKTLIF